MVLEIKIEDRWKEPKCQSCPFFRYWPPREEFECRANDYGIESHEDPSYCKLRSIILVLDED